MSDMMAVFPVGTHTASAEVSLYTTEEFHKGPALATPFARVCVREIEYDQIMTVARATAICEGHDVAKVRAATTMVTGVRAAWDKDGHAVGNWRG